MKIKSFTDLDTWKEAHQLVIEIYKITKDFPNEEKFGLVNQMRRAAVSITSNIAEGFSRQSLKEKIQFYKHISMSRRSIQTVRHNKKQHTTSALRNIQKGQYWTDSMTFSLISPKP